MSDILRKAKTEQHKNRFRYGELYHLNYCKTVKEKGRTYYEVYSLQRTQETPENDRELSFVCLKEDGAFVSASAVGQICRKAKAEIEGLEDFHFHTLRHMVKVEELQRLLRFTSKGNMLTEFDDAVFLSFVEQITVLSRKEVAFELKCGLSLRERLVEP